MIYSNPLPTLCLCLFVIAGGFYFVVNMFLTHSASFVAVYLYTHEVQTKSSVPSGLLWGALGALEASFLLFFSVFLSTIHKKYRKTFFSTITGRDYVTKRWRETSSVLVKIDIFVMNKWYRGLMKAEVEQWVRENYAIWVEEEPEWFTDRVRAMIPKEMIPIEMVESEKTDPSRLTVRPGLLQASIGIVQERRSTRHERSGSRAQGGGQIRFSNRDEEEPHENVAYSGS